MISELFDYFRSQAPKILKDLGYVYSSIALERRARRQKKKWAPHIQSCHDLWREILKDQYYNRVLILGSGPLTEVPMDLVLENCDELHLLDIVQPRTVKKKWGRHPKVHLHEKDITGVVHWLQEVGAGAPSSLNFSAAAADFKVDLVISANLLSQLTLEPGWYLNKKHGVPMDSAFMQKLIDKITSEHLEHLKSYGANKVVLYTDMKRNYLSPKGELLESHDSRVVPEEKLGRKIKEWRWTLCPLGEESDDYEIEMLEAAFEMACSTSSLHE